MALDKSKLPPQLVTEKAVWWRDSIQFGTLYISPQRYGNANRTKLEDVHGDVVRMIREKGQHLSLPQGWDVEICWFDDDYHVANFVSYAFRVPHHCAVMRRGAGIPPEMGYLLSGNLQLGEACNFRNFRNYVHGGNLKFLPFVIGQKHFRFNVFHPTPERVTKGLSDFQRLLPTIEGLAKDLPHILTEGYALVRLDEVSGVGDRISATHEEVERRLNLRLEPYTKKYGHLYQDLPGPQSVRPFSYEMFAAKNT